MTLLRPSRSTRLMSHAYIEADQSTCSRNHVGCVIARDRRIIATGYNGAPAGMPHCNHQVKEPPPGSDPYAWPPVRWDEGCKQAVHAEANAIAFAAKHGVGTDGADLYTTLSPCYDCAKLIINAGIARVYFDKVYRIKTGIILLQESGVFVGGVETSR